MKYLDRIEYTLMEKLDHYSIRDIQLEALLEGLEEVRNVEGDVVELGCNVGETSKVLQKHLVVTESSKRLWVYDSFEGLPEPTEQDYVQGVPKVKKGILHTSIGVLLSNFEKNSIPVPYRIISEWFSNIKSEDLPSRISFVFLDGDLYSSTLDGLYKVWEKVSVGGRVYIHDVDHPKLPGVREAIDYFSEKSGLSFNKTCYGLGFFVK